jgi:acyl carrier protein
MTAALQREILNDLTHVFADFQGREYSGAIAPEVRFFADLGLASIDAVVLGESLQDRYRRPLPFGELMAEMGKREDRDLSMGELAAFLAKHVSREDIPHAQN